MKKAGSLICIAITLPVIVWGVCGILPTFDDFTSLQSPWQVQIADEGYFFSDAVRRPFDYLLGLLVGYVPSLFPTLNHVLIVLGHAASALIVYTICRRLNMSLTATNIATLFFFFSPASLGATLACDGFNQTFAQLWGLAALWTYLTKHNHLWVACVVMAALSKENGLAWAVVPPILAYGFRLTDRRTALRHVGIGLAVAFVYFALYFTIYRSGMLGIEYAEEYSQGSWLSHLKDFMQLMAYTWLPIDYVSAIYPPSRNWAIVALTAILSLTFLLLLAAKCGQLLKSGKNGQPKMRRLLTLVACFFIIVSPHLVTLVSIMHNYAALSMAALIVACLITEPAASQPVADGLPVSSKPAALIALFALYLAACLMTDVHHYLSARESGLLGRQLALQAINQAPKPVERAFCISIDNEAEPRYSNFCVRPVDAFAWGLSVRHYSHYRWTTAISEIKLPAYDRQQVEALADSALHSGNEAVWVVGHRPDSLTIITHDQR